MKTFKEWIEKRVDEFFGLGGPGEKQETPEEKIGSFLKSPAAKPFSRRSGDRPRMGYAAPRALSDEELIGMDQLNPTDVILMPEEERRWPQASREERAMILRQAKDREAQAVAQYRQQQQR